MKEAVAILILFVPLVVELINDRRGDFNKSVDVVIRLINAITVGIFAYLIADKNILLAANLAIGIHFMFFDYAINYILYRNKIIASPYWFSYTGKSGVIDNIKGWKHLNPWLKLFIRILYLAIALFLYIKL